MNIKKNLIALSILSISLPLCLSGCNKKVEPITDKTESTIIKDAKNTDEYLKKKDYKSVAYAYIYNIKSGLRSYESKTTGTVKAKVLFIDYNITYDSVTNKNGNTFYYNDNSVSTLLTLKNEFYMVDKDKILISRDLKKYNVYTLEDYHKISYSPDQYCIMGYVFNEQSIINTEVISDKEDVITIKYTLDNELSTNLVKQDLKNNGGLSDYPKYESINITLSMKRDFTPISYVIDAVYEASKPLIGAARTTQHGECTFSKINENAIIPNESFLISQLGTSPQQIIDNDKERNVKDQLIDAVKNLDFKNGVNANGKVTLDVISSIPLELNIDANLTFDISRLSTDKIYQLLNLYAKLEGNSDFNSVISIVKTFAGDKLGKYEDLLKDFQSLEITYDGDGGIYLIPLNKDNVSTVALKIKAVDILDLLLKSVNVYSLVNGANSDLLTFNRIDGKDENTYQVEILLNEETVNTIKEKINTFLEDPNYALVKQLLNYKDFKTIDIKVSVENSVIKSLDAAFKYIAGAEGEEETIKTLISLHLDFANKVIDYAPHMEEAKQIYEAYEATLPLKTRLEYLAANNYLSRQYLEDLEKAYQEYLALSEQQKHFIDENTVYVIDKSIKDIKAVYAFVKDLEAYDLNNLNNQVILALAKLYRSAQVNTSYLKEAIGENKYNIITNLESKVDYSVLDNAMSKIVGSDEKSWNLTVEEIKGIKLLLDIGQYESSVNTSIMMKLFMSGNYMDTNTFATKINNLYNEISNN